MRRFGQICESEVVDTALFGTKELAYSSRVFVAIDEQIPPLIAFGAS